MPHSVIGTQCEATSCLLQRGKAAVAPKATPLGYPGSGQWEAPAGPVPPHSLLWGPEDTLAAEEFTEDDTVFGIGHVPVVIDRRICPQGTVGGEQTHFGLF